MPQKKNPDVAEYARGQAGRAAGSLMGLLMTLKSLPLAYNRDLQADKQNVDPALFTKTAEAFSSMAGLVASLDFDETRLTEAASDDTLLATDLAEALVARGLPFRAAHETVAELTRGAEENATTLADALRENPDALAPLSLEETLALLDPRSSIKRRKTPGGPSPSSTRTQVRKLRAMAAKRRLGPAGR
jgi:argininosuccinate lyase